MLARMEGTNSPVPLARVYEKMTYSHCNAASLLPCNPVQSQGGVIPLFFSWHHTAHHIPQTSRKSPELDRGVQDLLSQWLGSGLGSSASPKPRKTFLSTVLCLSICLWTVASFSSQYPSFIESAPKYTVELIKMQKLLTSLP